MVTSERRRLRHTFRHAIVKTFTRTLAQERTLPGAMDSSKHSARRRDRGTPYLECPQRPGKLRGACHDADGRRPVASFWTECRC